MMDRDAFRPAQGFAERAISHYQRASRTVARRTGSRHMAAEHAAARPPAPSRTAVRFANQMSPRLAATVLSVCVLALLSAGCLYRGNGDEPPEAAAVRSLAYVEQAVVAYKETHGKFPVLADGRDAPPFERNRIDFRALKDRGFVRQIPSSAFESGGYYYYVVVDPEGEPAVKLLDVRVTQAAADLQRAVDGYRSRTGEWPCGEAVAPDFCAVDFGKLGVPPRQAKSVFSSHYLPYVLHRSGRVAIHYALDLMRFVQQNGLAPEEGGELWPLLVGQSSFVPPAAFPYRWIGGEPVPVGLPEDGWEGEGLRAQ